MKRQIDLSTIPTDSLGKYQWSKSIGCECEFDYDDVQGTMKIVDTFIKNSRRHLIVQYRGKEFPIIARSFANANLYNIIFGIKGAQFQYKVGTTIQDDKRNFTIIDREYRTKDTDTGIENKKFYKLHCNVCGYEWWRVECHIDNKDKYGCPVCAGISYCEGINDITITDPWMIPYFVNGANEAKQFMSSSAKKVLMQCPDCGRVKQYRINELRICGHLPCACQDGMSYPNKFMYSFFSQLGVNFEYEKKFDWSENKVYDDYILLDSGETLICENHGGWHYTDNLINGRTCTEQQQIDQDKKSMALKNGINYYIELDCKNSDMDWIKNSILESQLPLLFDITQVDFTECDKFACHNLLKTVCEYKKEHPALFTNDIAEELKLNPSTVRQWLKRGSKLGLCDYDSSKERQRKMHSLRGNTEDAKPIVCLDTGKYYHSTTLFVNEYYQMYGKKLTSSNIRSVCIGKRHHVNNLHFSFITKEEFNKQKQNNPDMVVGNLFNKVA